LWWLIVGSKGGENRARIILELKKRPYNANKLAQKLSLDYKTIRHHIEVLNENKLVKSTGEKYGALYFLSDGICKVIGCWYFLCVFLSSFSFVFAYSWLFRLVFCIFF